MVSPLYSSARDINFNQAFEICVHKPTAILSFFSHFHSSIPWRGQAEENRYLRLITFDRLLEEPDIREVIIKHYCPLAAY